MPRPTHPNGKLKFTQPYKEQNLYCLLLVCSLLLLTKRLMEDSPYIISMYQEF